jgi:hypothetical protein
MQDFHNHPGKIGDREKMLNGEWPGNGCEYCKKIEDVGGVSERTGYINDLLLSPKELSLNHLHHQQHLSSPTRKKTPSFSLLPVDQ